MTPSDYLSRVAFLMMPFDETFDWLHQEIVRAAAGKGFRVVRADDVFAGGVVVDQIREAIGGADAVIAVCTGRNANVFYELGLSDSQHQPILVSEAADDLPFDVKHYRAHLYGNEIDDPKRTTIGERVALALEETLGRKKSSESEFTRTQPIAAESLETVVLDQHMMQLTVIGLHRKGSFDRIPIDMAAMVEHVDEIEATGRRARTTEIAEGESALGQPNYKVKSAAEAKGLIRTDFDLDDHEFSIRLTEKGRMFINALRKWSGRDGRLYPDTMPAPPSTDI